MTTYRLKRKSFTKYDETDTLKRMKDSDILAEKKKELPGYGDTVSKSLGGAALGASVGAAGGLVSGLGKGNALARANKLGKLGAIGGAAILGGMALKERNKQADDNSFYNKRLAYAQRQAVRREKKDWKSNMTQRDGYSY